jgi:hypothetical protein
MYPIQFPKNIGCKMHSIGGPIVIYVVAKMFDLLRDKRCVWWLMDAAVNFDGRIAPSPREGVESVEGSPMQVQDHTRP